MEIKALDLEKIFEDVKEEFLEKNGDISYNLDDILKKLKKICDFVKYNKISSQQKNHTKFYNFMNTLLKIKDNNEVE